MSTLRVDIPDPVLGKAIDTDDQAYGSRRALFLDRDGIININHGYVHTREATEWVPGIFDLARAARSSGLLLVVVTNQAGIARGYYTQEQFEDYTRWLHARFEEEEAPLAATYFCPHHPHAGVGDLCVECYCRKPKPGLLSRAAKDLGIDLSSSMMIGDSLSDIGAADAAGVPLAILCRETGGGKGLTELVGMFSTVGRR